MDLTSTTSITDDQELAKVLESMNQQGSTPFVPASDDTQDTPAPDTTVADEAPVQDTDAVDTPAEPETDTDTSEESPAEPTPDAAPEPTPEPAVTAPAEAEPIASLITPLDLPAAAADTPSDLDSIKKSALEELRPLVDKLDLPADEKFDTLLLLIRSTDDKTLVGAAHEAARGIPDETKRAQALLDVIKEIDFFSGHGQQPQ